MAIEAAFIVPHPPLAVHEVGRGEELKIASTIAGYEEVSRRIAEIAPETILIISPHTAYYSDWIYISGGTAATGNLAQFRAPQVKINLHYDTEFRHELEALAQEMGIPAGSVSDAAKPLDHGVMVPIYYLDEVYPSTNYEAVSIGGSALPRDTLMAFGRCLSDVAYRLNRKCVLLVSGDLSHKLAEDGPYGFDPAGPVFEEAFQNVVLSNNPAAFAELDAQMCEDAAECGLSGFIMMAGALEEQERLSGKSLVSELLSLEGPFGVGYGVASFEFTDESFDVGDPAYEQAYLAEDDDDMAPVDEGSADPLVEFARATIESYVVDGVLPNVPVLPADEPSRAGCFVSIHERDTGDLRGCIGTIAPTCSSLAEEIMQNAVSASTRDPRFYPIQPSELDNLQINVDVLQEPEPTTIDGLDPYIYGVIVTQGGRRGLLLPDLEGVDTVDQQLQIACQKAGIVPSPDYAGIDIERFKVVRHE